MSRTEWQNKFHCMPNSKKYWKVFHAYPEYTNQIELYYSHWKDHIENGYFIEQMEDFVTRTREVRFKMNMEKDLNTINTAPKIDQVWTWTNQYYLGNCTEAATPKTIAIPKLGQAFCGSEPQQEKGNNPMRYEQINATAVVTASPSDEALQRQYLLSQLQDYNACSWRDTSKHAELRKMFFMDTPRHPENAADLLDAIKNGKYTVDEKKLAAAKKFGVSRDFDDLEEYESEDYYTLWFGIEFTDFPKADRKGYEAAVKSYEKASKDTERKIIVGTPAEGLEALLALEAWTPTGKAN